VLEDTHAERQNNIDGSEKFLLALQRHHGVELPSFPPQLAPEPTPEPEKVKAIAEVADPIDPPHPKQALWFSIEGFPKHTVRAVQDAVCKKFNIDRTRLFQRRNFKGIVIPRQVAMWLACEVTVHSMPEIGRRFGGFDHTTVLHAARKIKRLIETDLEISKIAGELREQFDGCSNPSCLPADQTPGVATSNRSPPLPGRAGEAAIGPQNRTGSPATGQNDVAA